MQDVALTTTSILRRGQDVYGDSTVATYDPDDNRATSFDEVCRRAHALAAALRSIGVEQGDRVGTLMWGHQIHKECYLAVPSMGAVLHTLNPRLSADQLGWVIDHAEDRVIIVDASLVSILEPIADQLRTVEQFVVVGGGPDAGDSLGRTIDYEEAIAAAPPEYAWPDLDERDAATMCYTTGTTGQPKGVVYSHRALYLAALSQWGVFGLQERDRLLLGMPMFHVNASCLTYTAFLIGCDLLLPGRYLQAEHLAAFVARERATFAVGVPTVWNDVLRHAEKAGSDLSSLRAIWCGGSAVPRAMIEDFGRFGVELYQSFGMTETTTIAGAAIPPKSEGAHDELYWRTKSGRILPGVEVRVTAEDGTVLPRDGQTVGEIEIRGARITGAYYRYDAPESFREGWLRTGDLGTLDAKGFVTLTDRAKDVIKSGGEWISSVALEAALVEHADVREAAVIGVDDPRWQERPLAVVVLEDGASATPAGLAEFVSHAVARWWTPERWAFVAEIPRTSIGKIDKRRLRQLHASGALDVVQTSRASAP